jgi:hypothetical protein
VSATIDNAASPFEQWHSLRTEVEGLIGERATTLLAYTVAETSGATALASRFGGELAASGTSVAAPQVTETEGVLLEWARQVAADPWVTPSNAARFESAFTAATRTRIVRFAALTIATSVAQMRG